MVRPPAILTRRVTFGAAGSLISGADLVMEVGFTASTSVVWAATGSPLIAMLETVATEPGMQGFIDLPIPGQDGFIDGNGNAIRDWTYRADVVYLLAGRRVGIGIPKVFTVIEGDGDVDLDTMIPISNSAGVTVAIPDKWTQVIVDATAIVANLSTVASTGDYADLDGKPTIPTTAAAIGAEPSGLSAGTLGALSATYASLIQLAKNPDAIVTGAVTGDPLVTAAVLWPGGVPGLLTITARHATGAVNAYNITHVDGGETKTFTQPAITRATSGAVTNVPQIVVT